MEKDFALAASWYRKAAEQDNSLARCLLARMHVKGEGVTKSRSDAAWWFRKGAEGTNALALNGAAWFLATCPDAGLRDGPAAVGFAERAVAATGSRDPYILDTLAAAYAEVGQFEKAVALQKEVISGIREEKKGECAARLKLYEAGRPYREEDPDTGTTTNQTQILQRPQ